MSDKTSFTEWFSLPEWFTTWYEEYLYWFWGGVLLLVATGVALTVYFTLYYDTADEDDTKEEPQEATYETDEDVVVESQGSGSLRFQTQGVDRLVIDGVGNVGLGATTNNDYTAKIITSEQKTPFQLFGHENTPILKMQENRGFEIANGVIQVTPTGSNGDVTISGSLTANVTTFGTGSDGGVLTWGGSNDTFFNAKSGKSLNLRSNGSILPTYGITIDTSGRVGVGLTPGTSAQLQVSADASVRAQIYAESSHSLFGPYISLQGSHQWQIVSNKSENGGGANTLQFYDQQSNGDVFFNTTGNLGIGTPPSAKLHVHETLNTNTSYIHNDNPSFSNIICQIQAQRASDGIGWTFLSTRSNMGAGGEFEHLLRGDGSSDAEGSWRSTGADYAEYFESADGKAIEKGTSVVLDNDKVRPYDVELDQPDDIMGVSRPKEWGKSSASIGNSAGLRWANKYLTDEWGVYELEDYNVYEWKETNEETKEETKQWADYNELPDGETLESIQAKPNIIITVQQKKKLNPNYNPEQEYVPREKRDEWILVGLLGQVPVRSDQTVNPRWRKMKEITPTVWMYLIR
jgi:hypothetical protein